MQHSQLSFATPFQIMQLRSSVKICKPNRENNRLLLRSANVFAVWDTGAAISAISRRVADNLGLKVNGQAKLNTAAGFLDTFKDIVLLNLLIDDAFIPVRVAVVDNIPGDGNDFLIGLDVIRCGRLYLESDNEQLAFKVSFKPYPGLFKPLREIIG